MAESTRKRADKGKKTKSPEKNRRNGAVLIEKGCRRTTNIFFCVSAGTFGVLSLGFLFLMQHYFPSDSSFGEDAGIVVFAKRDDVHSKLVSDVSCSHDYEKEDFSDCLPRRCGRVVMDELVTQEEVSAMLRLATKGLALGGSSGGASILDLHSGALSNGTNFINIYSLIKSTNQDLFSADEFNIYRTVKNKIHRAVANEFNIPLEKLYLTKPTFFSRMNTQPAQTIHDEYWHDHVDKVTYGSFHYTSLLYLTNYGQDFHGGRFIFVDKDTNRTVEPRKGRVSFFTSGSENVHHVEEVRAGTRYAITVPFTCDPDKAISDPQI